MKKKILLFVALLAVVFGIVFAQAPVLRFRLYDTDFSHYLQLMWNEDRAANQTLNFITGAGDRTVTLSGNLTVESASLLNQDYTSDASPGWVNVTLTGYLDLTEIGAPANPGANVGRLYSRDDAGTTTLYYKDSAGAETDLLAGGGGGAAVAFKTITGITADVVADLADDTLTLASANNRLTIVGTAATDTITWTLAEGNIDHDALANFDANEHVDHTAITLTAGVGLTGGGTIAANRTFNVDVGIADDDILQVDDADDLAVDDYTKVTANGLVGRTYAQVRTDLALVIGTNVLAEQTIGIADDNLLEVDDADDLAVDDYTKVTANGLVGRTYAQVRTDLGLVIGTNVLAEQTIGILDDNLLEVDDADNLAANDYAKVTANGIVGRTYAQVLADLSGQAGAAFSLNDQNLTSVGTIGSDTITVVANNDVVLGGTGHVTSGSEGFIVGTLTITDGSIDDTDGSIALGATNLTGVGTIGSGDITINDGPPAIFTMTDGTYTHLIHASQAEGLAGSDVRIGLDPSTRIMILCEAADIAVDFGLAAEDHPALYIFGADADEYLKLHSATNDNAYVIASKHLNIRAADGGTGAGDMRLQTGTGSILAKFTGDRATAGGFFKLETDGVNTEFDDANGEQSMLSIMPRFNQTDTGAGQGILIDILEAKFGDGSTSPIDASAIIDTRIEGVPVWNVALERIVKVHTDDLFDADAVTDTSDIFSLPANSILMSCVMVLDTQFAGIDDLKVEVGVTGIDTDGFLLPGAMDLVGDAAASNYSQHGSYWDNAAGTGGFYYSDAALTITALATTTDADGLDETSAGQVIFYFTFFKLITTT